MTIEELKKYRDELIAQKKEENSKRYVIIEDIFNVKKDSFAYKVSIKDDTEYVIKELEKIMKNTVSQLVKAGSYFERLEFISTQGIICNLNKYNEFIQYNSKINKLKEKYKNNQEILNKKLDELENSPENYDNILKFKKDEVMNDLIPVNFSFGNCDDLNLNTDTIRYQKLFEAKAQGIVKYSDFIEKITALGYEIELDFIESEKTRTFDGYLENLGQNTSELLRITCDFQKVKTK